MTRLILVTGCLGNIGSKLIRYLAENHSVRKITIPNNWLTQLYMSLFYLPR